MSDGHSGSEEPDPPKLGFKDYIAMAIAALETFLLPLVAIAIVLGLVALYFVLRP